MHAAPYSSNCGVQGAPLRDVSPEYSLGYIPTRPFDYDLRPGQGVVLITERDVP